MQKLPKVQIHMIHVHSHIIPVQIVYIYVHIRIIFVHNKKYSYCFLFSFPFFISYFFFFLWFTVGGRTPCRRRRRSTARDKESDLFSSPDSNGTVEIAKFLSENRRFVLYRFKPKLSKQRERRRRSIGALDGFSGASAV